MRRLAALALVSAAAPAATAQRATIGTDWDTTTGCGQSMGECDMSGGAMCPDENGERPQYCNFANNRVQRRTVPSCERCDGGGTHATDGSVNGGCNCGLPPRGQAECSNRCALGNPNLGPKLGTDGCCCNMFQGQFETAIEIQSLSDCGTSEVCADTDLACCVHAFSGDGTCNEHFLPACDTGASPPCDSSGDVGVVNPSEQCTAVQHGDSATGSVVADWDQDCRPGAGDTNHTDLSPIQVVLIIGAAIVVAVGATCMHKKQEAQKKGAMLAAAASVANPAAAGTFVANPLAAGTGMSVVAVAPAVAVQPMQQMQVVCPDGVAAGSMIQVQIGEQMLSVQVPAGVGPGQAFSVQAPA